MSIYAVAGKKNPAEAGGLPRLPAPFGLQRALALDSADRATGNELRRRLSFRAHKHPELPQEC